MTDDRRKQYVQARIHALTARIIGNEQVLQQKPPTFSYREGQDILKRIRNDRQAVGRWLKEFLELCK